MVRGGKYLEKVHTVCHLCTARGQEGIKEKKTGGHFKDVCLLSNRLDYPTDVAASLNALHRSTHTHPNMDTQHHDRCSTIQPCGK